jgi:hypothetical protein
VDARLFAAGFPLNGMRGCVEARFADWARLRERLIRPALRCAGFTIALETICIGG